LSIQFVLYFSFILFLLGIFGVLYKKDFVSSMVSFQLIIFSAVINFLGFSHFIYQASTFDKVFILIGIIVLELYAFSILYYKYSSRTYKLTVAGEEDHRVFVFCKSDWWGDDQ